MLSRTQSRSDGMTPRRGGSGGSVWTPRVARRFGKLAPCVVISSDVLNQRRRTVVVIPLTTVMTSRPPILVPVTLPKQSCSSVIDQIRAVAKERLDRRIAELSPRDLDSLQGAIRELQK